MSPASSSPRLPGGDALGMQKLRNLVQAQKPDIKIKLNSARTTYSTLDKIEGTVSITAPTDTQFDVLDIEFVGTSRAYVERVTTAAAVSGRSEAFHQFLKLTQPGLQELYPENGLLKAGQTYDFPFVFAVPQQLLLRVCKHKVVNPAVRDAHLALPPSFGDKDLDRLDGGLDDMAPDMASIRYGIFAKFARVKAHDDEVYRVSIASKARRVRVVPAMDEHPPLDVGGEESEFTMRKEKSVRKGMLKGKSGTLVMEAAQPQSLCRKAHDTQEYRTTTMATVMLRFDPTDEGTQPPKLGSLASKLKVNTFFSSTARPQFPSKQSSLFDLAQGMHSEQLNLSSRCMANVEWTKVDPAKTRAIDRRDSACSTTSITTGSVPEPSATYKGKCYYTARLLVPITLPNNKAFVPTFHSCLASRTYQLKLELSLGGIGTSMDLKLPIQISSENNSGEVTPRRDSMVDSGDEVDAEDAGDFFEARVIRAPSEGFVGRSRIGSQAPVSGSWDDAPPGYSPYVVPGQGRHMSVPVY